MERIFGTLTSSLPVRGSAAMLPVGTTAEITVCQLSNEPEHQIEIDAGKRAIVAFIDCKYRVISAEC